MHWPFDTTALSQLSRTIATVCKHRSTPPQRACAAQPRHCLCLESGHPGARLSRSPGACCAAQCAAVPLLLQPETLTSSTWPQWSVPCSKQQGQQVQAEHRKAAQRGTARYCLPALPASAMHGMRYTVLLHAASQVCFEARRTADAPRPRLAQLHGGALCALRVSSGVHRCPTGLCLGHRKTHAACGRQACIHWHACQSSTSRAISGASHDLPQTQPDCRLRGANCINPTELWHRPQRPMQKLPWYCKRI